MDWTTNANNERNEEKSKTRTCVEKGGDSEYGFGENRLLPPPPPPAENGIYGSRPSQPEGKFNGSLTNFLLLSICGVPHVHNKDLNWVFYELRVESYYQT